ncbi:MAG: CoA transferase [Marmoricola sp.]|nr:CoA transferase [Marmoricola sp.]
MPIDTISNDVNEDSFSDGPLAGLLVLDLSRALAGPHAAMTLGDLGARVIKVEAVSGDDTRGWGPPFRWPTPTGSTGEPQAGVTPESTYFLAANRNKESIVLDLKAEVDRDVLLELVERADVLIENFRTGVLERLGLGLGFLLQLNPRLVALSITGFGHDGPEGGRAGYDQIAQGEGGLMSLTGSSPSDLQRVGTPISDLLGGLTGTIGLLAALTERAVTGRGQIVRTSLLASTVGILAQHATAWTVAGQVGNAQGNHHASIAPYGVFDCADGQVQIAVGSERLWHTFCAGFGLLADAEGMATNPERVRNLEATKALIQREFARWTSQDLLKKLEELGVPAGSIRRVDEVCEWDQTKSQHLMTEVKHETLGNLRLPASPLRFFNAEERERPRRAYLAPPTLDQNGAAIREWVRS